MERFTCHQASWQKDWILWKLTGGFELMDVANGFFMVKFGLEVDKTKVINEGPWTVFDHHLAVSH
jgi:hypothetical protein